MGRTLLVRVTAGGKVWGELAPSTLLGIAPQLMEGTWVVKCDERDERDERWSATVVASFPEAQDIPEVTWATKCWD